jgi:hypothetical protein
MSADAQKRAKTGVTGVVTLLAYSRGSKEKELTMNRFDGTAERQLDLHDDVTFDAPPQARPRRPEPQRPTLRLLRKDVYAELARRRRRAQIAARHEIDK